MKPPPQISVAQRSGIRSPMKKSTPTTAKTVAAAADRKSVRLLLTSSRRLGKPRIKALNKNPHERLQSRQHGGQQDRRSNGEISIRRRGLRAVCDPKRQQEQPSQSWVGEEELHQWQRAEHEADRVHGGFHQAGSRRPNDVPPDDRPPAQTFGQGGAHKAGARLVRDQDLTLPERIGGGTNGEYCGTPENLGWGGHAVTTGDVDAAQAIDRRLQVLREDGDQEGWYDPDEARQGRDQPQRRS